MFAIRCSFSLVCASALLRKPAMADVDAIATLALRAGDIYASAARKLPTSEEASHMLDTQDAKLLFHLQADGLAQEQAEQRDAQTAGGACPACAKDYDINCPSSWISARNGVCIAPSSYNGPCVMYGSFSNYAAQDKQFFERRCAACWPCVPGVQPAGDVHGPVSFISLHEASIGDRFVLNLKPPQQDEYEMQRGLDAVMRASESQRGIADAAFASDKQSVLDTEKTELSNAVRNALA